MKPETRTKMSIFADLPGDPELGERLIQAIDDATCGSTYRYRVPDYATHDKVIDALLTAYYERDGDLIADDLVELIAADPQLTMSRLLKTPHVFADWLRHELYDRSAIRMQHLIDMALGRYLSDVAQARKDMADDRI